MLRNRPFHCAACFVLLAAGALGHAQDKPKKEPTFALPPAPGSTPGGAPAAAPGGAPAGKPGEPAKPGAKKPDAKEEKERVPVKLDIKVSGRPEGKELDVPARYYVWTDPDGWHVRSCCKDKYFATFKGEVTLKNGGTFEKFRPIELERKGAHPDAWEVSADRTKLQFIINSSDHPDGFDFTVKGDEAAVVFDLKVAGKEQPKRIFIGHDNLHPPSAYFEFPANHR
jgi:hypothetical protein